MDTDNGLAIGIVTFFAVLIISVFTYMCISEYKIACKKNDQTERLLDVDTVKY